MVRPNRKQATQSQRPAPTQTQQAGPSRSQAGPRFLVDSDSDAEVVDASDPEPAGSEDGDDDGVGDIVDHTANNLVRLALFHEAKRLPLRRDEINKRVMQDSRNFKQVYSRAQRILASTFGLQLQELPSKTGLDQEAAEAAAESKKAKHSGRSQATQAEDQLEEARQATTGRKKAAAVGSKTYILRSVLDSRLIELANKTDAEILEEEALLDFGSGNFSGGGARSQDGALDDDGDWDDGAEVHPRTYGTILSWSQNDQLGSLGVLYVILALILVNGKVLQERILRAQLNELGLSSTPGRSSIQLTSLSTHRSLKLDDYLSQLVRQGYLDRQVVGETAGAGRKRARGKVGGDAKNDSLGGGTGDMYEWRWGARALCEVGEEDIARFVSEFMVSHGAGATQNDGDDEDGAEAERTKEKVTRMYKGVEKAAGGGLAKIRDWD